MTRAAWDTAATDYQARLLIAALDDSQHCIPSAAKARTLEIMHGREGIRARRATSTLAAVESGAKDYVLTHHGVNAANRARTAQLAERYPVATVAVYVPEEGEENRDIVVVTSEPSTDGTVQVHSVKQNGPIRVPLAMLRQLPPLPPEPEGEITGWWVITDVEGVELARVEAEDDPGARKAAMRHASVVAAARRDKGFAVRRLYTSELSIPVGELHGLPRISPAPAPRTVTVHTEFIGRSIPTRLRAAETPGGMVNSPAAGGALRWRLPDGEELTPGEAAKRFLSGYEHLTETRLRPVPTTAPPRL